MEVQMFNMPRPAERVTSRPGVARRWELVIYSRELKYFAIYFYRFIVTYFIDRKIAWKIMELILLMY